MRKLVSVISLLLGLAVWSNADASPRKSFSSNGTKIAFDVYSEGPPIVLIHGLTGSKNDFSELRKRLVDDGFRVIVFDVRGHGASDKPHSPMCYGERIVTDICRLLDYLTIDTAHIVGYSMGGDIANKFREMYPTRIRACVIGGSGLGVSIGWADDPHNFAEIADSLANCDGFLPLLRQSGAISPGIASEKDITAVNSAMMKGQDAAALSALLRRYDMLDVDRDKLKDNTVRTLVIVGSRDAEHASAIELTSMLPNSELHVIQGVNHFEAWTHKEFTDTVSAFLTGSEESK